MFAVRAGHKMPSHAQHCHRVPRSQSIRQRQNRLQNQYLSFRIVWLCVCNKNSKGHSLALFVCAWFAVRLSFTYIIQLMLVDFVVVTNGKMGAIKNVVLAATAAMLKMKFTYRKRAAATQHTEEYIQSKIILCICKLDGQLKLLAMATGVLLALSASGGAEYHFSEFVSQNCWYS